MSRLAREAGVQNTVIVNTCAVTAEAVRQAAQQIRRLRRDDPGARVVVTGCGAQIDPGRFAAMPEVDHVLGNAEKMRPQTWRSLAAEGDGAARMLVGDIMAERSLAPVGAADPPPVIPRAFVPIQNGCDHRCTFCVIPFGRGRSRSMPARDVVARVRALVKQGLAEVVLTGVDITAWGADLEDAPRLGGLVREILREVPELARLRLSSLDQAETDPVLLAALAEEPRLMPHLHLSLQSGSDLILKRMRRRHSRADAVAFCDRVRRLRPDIAFGADLIAGFPTESEAHFADTLSLIDDCGLAFLHVFPYSAREGTPAARMPHVPAETIRERGARLRAKAQTTLSGWLEAQSGRRVEVCLERSGAGDVPGRTPQFAQVLVSNVRAAAAGQSLPVVVRGNDGRRLLAEAVT